MHHFDRVEQYSEIRLENKLDSETPVQGQCVNPKEETSPVQGEELYSGNSISLLQNRSVCLDFKVAASLDQLLQPVNVLYTQSGQRTLMFPKSLVSR